MRPVMHSVTLFLALSDEVYIHQISDGCFYCMLIIVVMTDTDNSSSVCCQPSTLMHLLM